jgi:ATP-dependent exoDNAse (exonuclease V) beta subunit
VVPLDSRSISVEAITSVQGRVFGATLEEVAAATETVMRTLSHPLLRRAAQAELSGKCRREVPVTAKIKEGVVVEGVVDLAYEDNDVWVVVDYKTDFEIEGRLETYQTQVRLYALAISLAADRDTRPILLRV